MIRSNSRSSCGGEGKGEEARYIGFKGNYLATAADEPLSLAPLELALIGLLLSLLLRLIASEQSTSKIKSKEQEQELPGSAA